MPHLPGVYGEILIAALLQWLVLQLVNLPCISSNAGGCAIWFGHNVLHASGLNVR